MEVKLTAEEDQLCTLLDECTRRLKKQKNIQTSCRIAGGWVRDKLLGHQSNDIDIALEDIMGFAFAEHFVEYCRSAKNMEMKGLTKIESNPDQSKHLETARTTVLGIELDFVNLRSEEYAENSRIPTQVTFGTPLQDALRRDITINALFYNVHSRQVEDHIGKGLEDLRNGTVRTPLAPRETFLDDPLRVIRCIRFASRFGFEMVPELQAAARDPEIQGALTSKISRERVGEEIDKMMKGRDPLRSIRLIHDLSLFSSIFHIPKDVAATLSAPPTSSETSLVAASCLHALLNLNKQNTAAATPLTLPPLHASLLSATQTQPSPLSRLYLASALTPYRGITYTGAKKRQLPAVKSAIQEGLKLGVQHHYLDGIPALYSAVNVLGDAVLGRGHERPAVEWDRARIGLLLRQDPVHNPNTGSHWATSLLFSLVQELVPLWDSQQRQLNVEEAASLVNVYNAFIARVEEFGLQAAVDAKAIIDGHTVTRVLGAKSGGPWLGKVLARVVEWQLGNPDGTPALCEEWLRAEQAADRITIDVGVAGKRKEQGGENASKKARR